MEEEEAVGNSRVGELEADDNEGMAGIGDNSCRADTYKGDVAKD